MTNKHRTSTGPEKTQKGFILLLTVLITSVILAISFSIYSITLKELVMASFLKNSAQALVAADRAAECALYWDRATPQNGMQYTIFPTSTQYAGDVAGVPAGSLTLANALCDTGAANIAITNNGVTGWLVSGLTATQGRTFFRMQYTDGTCAEVTVFKNDIETTVTASGFNTACASSMERKTQRIIEIRSNI